MLTKFLDKTEVYDGSQLVSLRSYLKHGLLGDSVVSWTGACDVSLEHMVDGEDLLVSAKICGSNMLHFIIEKFATPLIEAVTLQRLFASKVRDEMAHRTGLDFIREGDDVYFEKRKLSISIATVSPVSSLIHFAINISNDGTPVPTCALDEWRVDPKELAIHLMESFKTEVNQIDEATKKVKWVR